MNHAAASEVGQAFNHPLFVVGTSVHEGSWPSESSFIRHKGEGIVFDCFKRAEDGKSFIFRCHNAQQKNNSPKIEFSPLLGKLADVESVDLLERPDGNTASVIEYGENWVMIDIASKSIASFRVKFE
jgi:alpha-mannosidase